MGAQRAIAGGKAVRLNRIFGRDGRALVIAMDHGGTMGALPGLEEPGVLIPRLVAGGADAIMTTPGLAARFGERVGRAGLIVRLDGGRSRLGKEADLRRVFGVEDAVRLGADAVVCMGFPGTTHEAVTLGSLAEVAAECRRWEVPLVAEMVPGGFEEPESRWTTENVRMAARIGAEMGADIIKTCYPGDPEGFRDVVAVCFVPVLVLGGPRTATTLEALRMVREALDAGARGAIIGRHVWQHSAPERMVAALAALVHADASVEQAAREVEP